jgi:hypothetical protein
VQAINNGRAHRRVALDDSPTHTDIQWPITAVSQRIQGPALELGQDSETKL